jgi:3-deoxy-D-manno-octulosonic-acid transferase
MLGIYALFVRIYFIGIRLFSLFNPKAKLFVEGRRNWENELKKIFPVDKKVIWFHCASLGEFEQGRPVMEKFKTENPEYFLLLTFFSPSGYLVKKDYLGADAVFYLPTDSSRNAKKFLGIVSPEIVVFVKYEFWFCFISEIINRKIPLIFVSCIFRPTHFLFKWYGKWATDYLKKCRRIFVQDGSSLNNLKKLNFTNIEIAKDTRFDRVFENSKNIELPKLIIEWAQTKKVFVFGSTWHEDEIAIKNLIKNLQKTLINVGFIIVPHETNQLHINFTKKLFKDFKLKLFSENSFTGADLIVVDKIGLLSKLYSISNISYVGGGFGRGIHNLLEPAVFGVPVVFGENNAKFEEAQNLKALKAGFEISDSESLINIYNFLLVNESEYKAAGENAKKYIIENTGGSHQILKYLKNQLNKPL